MKQYLPLIITLSCVVLFMVYAIVTMEIHPT